jgi:hypothetical protein
MYITLFAILTIPIVLSVINSEIENHTVHRITLSILLLLAVISPAAFLFSNPTETSSWLTDEEADSITTLQTYIPADSRVGGSYHTAAPLVYTHSCVVGPTFAFSQTNYVSILNGMYYDVNKSTNNRAMQIMERRFGEIDVLLLSQRVTDAIGVQTEARNLGPAPDTIFTEYESLTSVDKIYSGEIYAYNRRTDSSCTVRYEPA